MHQYPSQKERALRGRRLSARVDRAVEKDISKGMGPHDAAMALLVVGGRLLTRMYDPERAAYYLERLAEMARLGELRGGKAWKQISASDFDL